MATRSTLFRLGGDSSDAQKAIREVRQEIRRLGREEARARISVSAEGVEAQIERVRARLERLSKQEATPAVRIATARATEQLTRLELRLERLRTKDITIDVDFRRGALERTAAGLGSVERGVQGVAQGFAGVFQQVPILGGLLSGVFGGAFSLVQNLGTAVSSLVTRGLTSLVGSLGSLGSLAGPIGSVAGSFVSLGLSLVSVAAVAGVIVIALNAILGAVIALGGALVALVASATAAAAGLAALAVAFGALLAPVVLVAIALVSRFTAVLQARKAHEQEITSAIQQQKTAEDQRKAALDQVKQATQALGQATVDARHAMAQAAIDQHNAELALSDSKLGVKSAQLGVLDAKKALRDLLTQANVTGGALDHLFKQFSDVHVDPTKLQGLLGGVTAAGGDASKVDPLALAHAILNLQQAQQGVKDAVNQTANAERNLGDATRRRADFAKRGLNAYAPYRAALHRVVQAEDKLRQAQDKVSHARVVYDRKLKALSQTEKGFLTQLDPFIAKLKDLAKVVSAPIFRGLESAMGSLTRLFSNAGIQQSLVAIGTALGNFFAKLGHELTSRDWRSAFEQFARAGARMIGSGGQGFIYLLQILREIARKALPAVETAAHGVVTWLGRIAGQPGRIHRAVGTVVDQFRVWAKFAGAVARLVIALFSAAAPAGRSLATSLTRIVDRWTAWVNSDEGQQRVRAFFRNAVIRARQILSGIKDVVTWLKDHLPEAAQKAKKAFEDVYKVIKPIVDAIKFVSSIPDSRPTSGKGDSAGSNAIKRVIRQLFHIGFASGGVVPGVGRGDIMPAMLEPGEFVLRRAVVAQIGLPALQALNGGGVVTQPTLMPAGGDTHHHYHVPRPAGGGNPDPRSTLEHIHRLITLKG